MFLQHQHDIKSRETLTFIYSKYLKLRNWFFPSFQRDKCFSQLNHILCFCSFTFNRYHCQIVSLWSVIVDQWNVLINLNLMKLRSTVLHTAVIGKTFIMMAPSPLLGCN